MKRPAPTALIILRAIALAAFGWSAGPVWAEQSAVGDRFEVRTEDIDDIKSVYATVRSKDVIEARVRTPGTVAALKIDEGSSVTPGQVLALVADPKIAIRIKALDAHILAAQSRMATTEAELERSEALKSKGVSPQSRVDQAKTAFEVASNDLKALRAERAVVETQIQEGEVLSPSAGRVLKVPVTEGSVVMAGESVATIAANAYLLRLELPERHARFIKAGDVVHLGHRGLEVDRGPLVEGRVTQVYPELHDGRVIADAEVDQLGSYFVGERVLVYLSAGKRAAIAVPSRFVSKRYGLDVVRVEDKSGALTETVVQVGRPVTGGTEPERIEILSGLAPGDRLAAP